MTHEFEGVKYLIECYFHQDWDINGNNDEEVVDSFCKEEVDSVVRESIESFSSFLKYYSKNQSAVDDYFDKRDCGYYYQYDKLTGYQWAERLEMLLKKYYVNKA